MGQHLLNCGGYDLAFQSESQQAVSGWMRAMGTSVPSALRISVSGRKHPPPPRAKSKEGATSNAQTALARKIRRLHACRRFMESLDVLSESLQQPGKNTAQDSGGDNDTHPDYAGGNNTAKYSATARLPRASSLSSSRFGSANPTTWGSIRCNHHHDYADQSAMTAKITAQPILPAFPSWSFLL